VQPRIVAIGGPLKEATFSLPEGEVTLGRDATNGMSVIDPSVSRKHCLFRREDSRCLVKDLGSRNGTVVNGVAVKEHELSHGDEIAVGDSVFLFLIEADERSRAGGGVEFDDAPSSETRILQPREIVYLHPDRLLEALPASLPVARNLNALLKISRVVHAIRNLDELQAQLLSLIFEVVPAGRGAILLSDDGEEFVSRYASTRQRQQTQLVKVSRTVANRVIREGTAILGCDVPHTGELRDVESLAESQVRSLLCVPLTVFERVTGCIYLDSTQAANRFTEDHLQLVAGIAGICAVALDNARRLQWLEDENRRLFGEISKSHSLVGESSPMEEVYRFIAKAAPSDSTVLIDGESGTGKELVARALHSGSARAKKPFIAISCAAIPESLLEAELFGHERGAFTGANALKKGKLEFADGGVVFLDEIGELPLSIQVKLLRVLQEREFERLGGTRPVKVNIRLIAATNRDLKKAIKNGEFRSDLYYRLAVVGITLPPLRKRRGDIPLLARHFIQKYASSCGMKAKPVSREAMACLANYEWPGNVRELENAMERALVLGASDTILPEDLPETVLEHVSGWELDSATYHSRVKEFKKQLIVNAIEQTNGNYVEAAKILQVHPNYLHRLIRNLEIKDAIRETLEENSN